MQKIEVHVDEVTVSLDEETVKSEFIDRELSMSVPGFGGPQTYQVACPTSHCLDQT